MESYVIKVTEFITEIDIHLRGPQQPLRLFLEELPEYWWKKVQIPADSLFPCGTMANTSYYGRKVLG